MLGAASWLGYKYFKQTSQTVVYRTKQERQNAELRKDGAGKKSSWLRNVSFAVVLNVVLILLSLYTVVTLVEQLKISAEVRGFDPFAVRTLIGEDEEDVLIIMFICIRPFLSF